jgi:hypothetical protein
VKVKPEEEPAATTRMGKVGGPEGGAFVRGRREGDIQRLLAFACAHWN